MPNVRRFEAVAERRYEVHRRRRVEAPSRGRAHEKFTAATGAGKYVLELFSAYKRDLAR